MEQPLVSPNVPEVDQSSYPAEDEMNTITADPLAEASLLRITGPVVVYDGEGRVLGYYVPASTPNAELYARAAAAFDIEEMRRRRLSGDPGVTTAEAIRSLSE